MSATGVQPSGSGPAPVPAVLIVDDEAAARTLLRKTVQGLYPSAASTRPPTASPPFVSPAPPGPISFSSTSCSPAPTPPASFFARS